jgi:hypothetical protein
LVRVRLRGHHFYYHRVIVDLDPFNDAAVEVGPEEGLFVGGIL